jgi:hypothetical protein
MGAVRDALVQAAHLVADAIEATTPTTEGRGLPTPSKRKRRRPPPPPLVPAGEVSETTRAMARRELQRLGYPVGSKER